MAEQNRVVVNRFNKCLQRGDTAENHCACRSLPKLTLDINHATTIAAMTIKRYSELAAHIGAAIAELRTGRNLTQQEVSAGSGIARSYLSAVERGKYDILIRSLCAFSSAFDIAPDLLLYQAERRMRSESRPPAASELRLKAAPASETDLMKSLGIVIVRCRANCELSQSEIAQQAGVHRTLILEIEHGRGNFSVGVLCAIAYALNTAGYELLATALDECGRVNDPAKLDECGRVDDPDTQLPEHPYNFRKRSSARLIKTKKRNTTLPTHLGAAIKAARLKLDLSWDEFTHAGITVKYVYTLESGEIDTSIIILCKIARALRMAPNQLLFEAERKVIPGLKHNSSSAPPSFAPIEREELLRQVGATIEKRRRTAGPNNRKISRDDFAGMVHMNAWYLNVVEKGRSALSVGMFCAIAYTLNTSGCELLAEALGES